MSHPETSCLWKGFVRCITVEMRFKKLWSISVVAPSCTSVAMFFFFVFFFFEILQTKLSLLTIQKKAKNLDKDKQKKSNWRKLFARKISENCTLTHGRLIQKFDAKFLINTTKVYPKIYMIGSAAYKRFKQTLGSSNWLN